MVPRRPIASTLARYDRRSRSSGDRISSFLREMYGLLLDQVNLRAWNRVLTVECGDGWPAEEAWRRLRRGYVCGIDMSPAMTELASRLRAVSGQLEFKFWSGEKLPFDDGSFDYVLSSFAFHRYARPASVLGEMHRVLKEEGRLYLLEPERRSFGGLYALWDYYHRFTDRGHVRYYAASELLQLVEDAGFGSVKLLQRWERALSGGKLLASAMIVQGQREVLASGFPTSSSPSASTRSY
jgi:ubiquinone/menaquinone biosynthesis C-methylase UbiE